MEFPKNIKILFENTKDIMLITNKKGKVVFISNKYLEITGYTNENFNNDWQKLLKYKYMDKNVFEQVVHSKYYEMFYNNIHLQSKSGKRYKTKWKIWKCEQQYIYFVCQDIIEILDNTLLTSFIKGLSTIVYKNQMNYEFLLTKLLVELTTSNYGYFNNVINKDEKYYNEALFMIDSTNKVDKKLIDRFCGSKFPLNNNEHHVWASNFYKPNEISIFNVDEHYSNRKCPIKQFNYYCNIPLNYNNEVVGCIALANDTNVYDDIKTTLLYISYIISNLIWSQREIYKNLLLKEEIKSQTYYISQISHELKTPLNAIMGFAQLLKEDITKSDVFLEYIIDNGEKLLSLINEYLNLNRLDFFNIKKIQLDLSYYLNKAILYNINRKDLTINNNIVECIINTDKKLLITLLDNILSNVNKYTTENGIVNIYIKQVKDKLWLYVENSGQLNLKKDELFKPFIKGNIHNIGHGLGLSMIKKSCDILNENVILSQIEDFVSIRISFTL